MFGTAQDLIFLFGDSITQAGFSQDQGFGWVAALASDYVRKLNVVNAGLGGYNTRKGLYKLPILLPPPEHARIRILTIFFGANDSRLPNTSQPTQDVPIEEYKANLKSIVLHPLVKAHGARIILITPPPIDERMCEHTDRTTKGIYEVRRTAESTSRYAQAVRDVSKELNVVHLDIWSAFMKKAGWKFGEPLMGSKAVPQNFETGLPSLLSDGLHLTAKGNRLVYEELMRLLQDTWPDQTPEALPRTLPGWDDVEAWKDL